MTQDTHTLEDYTAAETYGELDTMIERFFDAHFPNHARMSLDEFYYEHMDEMTEAQKRWCSGMIDHYANLNGVQDGAAL